MTACPRCDKGLRLHGQGLLRCDDHGTFLPENAFRATSAYAVSAQLRAMLTHAAATGFRCASCRSDLRETRIGEMSADGCASCGGWWFDRDQLELLRAAMLSHASGRTRVVGGYGGTSTIRPPHPWGSAAEGLFALLNAAGAFRT